MEKVSIQSTNAKVSHLDTTALHGEPELENFREQQLTVTWMGRSASSRAWEGDDHMESDHDIAARARRLRRFPMKRVAQIMKWLFRVHVANFAAEPMDYSFCGPGHSQG